MEATSGLLKQSPLLIVNDKNNGQQKKQCDPAVQSLKDWTSSFVFKGKIFCFSPSFPEDRRAEIIDWVTQGGGEMVEDHVKQKVHFIIECHGVVSRSATDTQITYVSSHWVRSCLEDGCLLDVGSHILYSPLTCRIPMPGFERFRFCVSQYEEKDRLLLRNLCFVLGARFVEKLTKKVTHLLCKFTNGPKYDAASRWGICSVTSEWIYECVRLVTFLFSFVSVVGGVVLLVSLQTIILQSVYENNDTFQNQVVSSDSFCPKEVTAQDQEAGLCTVSQFPTQAVQMISGDIGSGYGRSGNEGKQSNFRNKKARLLRDEQNHLLPSVIHIGDPVSNENSAGSNKVKDTGEVAHVVPDVAAAIEDLLEQTSKIYDHKSQVRNGGDKSIFSSECTGLHEEHRDSHLVSGLSRHWLNKVVQEDKICSSGDASEGLFGGFSESQTDSQVVGYEEDLSGRQMLIDRVLTHMT